MNFANLKVSTRLAWSFGSLIALMAIIIGAGLLGMMNIDHGMETLIDNRMPKVERLNDIAFRTMDNARIVRNIVLLTDEKAKASNKAQYDKNGELIGEHLDYLRERIVSPADQSALKAIVEARTAYREYTARVLEQVLANKAEEATKTLYGEGYKTQAAYFAAIKVLVDSQKAKMTAVAGEAKATYESARTTMLALGVISVLVALGLAWIITRGLLAQLGGEPSQAAEIAQRVAAGDLSQHIPVKPGDQTSLMAHFSAMQDSLVGVVNGVRGNAESVATASAQIAQGNQDLSSRTEEQASALEETAASMEQLGSTVRQNADNAQQANQLAKRASEVATAGGQVVSDVVATMSEINGSSKKIADIIAVIDGIAFQTNILALNAAVEAARAGEQGRGFAVVAGEVRTLAQRSADAAKEIKSLINASVERVEQGSALVDKAGSTMEEIVHSIRRVTDIMGEISAASGEQSAGVAQVGEAVSQMDRATQQNAALVEESAAAAESLKSQASALVEAVSVFKLAREAQAAPAATTLRSPSERRGPQRAKNVARPDFGKEPARQKDEPGKPRPARSVAANAEPAQSRDGTNGGDWTTF